LQHIADTGSISKAAEAGRLIAAYREAETRHQAFMAELAKALP